jgi:hypothetical protein
MKRQLAIARADRSRRIIRSPLIELFVTRQSVARGIKGTRHRRYLNARQV